MKLETFSIGSKHFANEDRFVVQNMGIFGVTVVLADGMGGLSLGDKAAEVTTKSVADYLMRNYHGFGESEILHKALEYADKELRNVSIANKSKMGAAVAVVIVLGRHLYCTWQGNVRVYVRHDGNLNLVTEDHIAQIGYGMTALTRCVKGAGLRDDLPFVDYELADDDVVFLCTDGMYNVAENCMLNSSVDEIKAKIGSPEDDASLIKITDIVVKDSRRMI